MAENTAPYKRLKTGNIFIDTSEFFAHAFGWNSPALSTLRVLCQGGILKLKITNITKREIYRHISLKAVNAIKEVQKHHSDIRILSNLDRGKWNSILGELNSELAVQRLHALVEDFLKDCEAETISD